MAPELRSVHGTHSDGDITRVDWPAGGDGSIKSVAEDSDAANKVALSISKHSIPTMAIMIPTAMNNARHTVLYLPIA